MNNPKYIILHTSDVSYNINPDQLKAIDNYHKEQGFPISSLGYYVGYHVLINNGMAIRCRLDTDEGAHCNQRENGISINFQSLGICCGFDGDIEQMKQEDYLLFQEQVWKWQDEYKIPNENVRFHRYYAKTKTCPGSLLDEAWRQKLLKRPTTIPTSFCIVELEELKKRLSWYEQLLNWFFRRV